jgi:hypothetical protein
VRGILAELAFPLETETFAFGKQPHKTNISHRNAKDFIEDISEEII